MFYRTALILCDVQKKVMPRIFNGNTVIQNIGNLIDCYKFNQYSSKNSPIIVGEFLPHKLGNNVFNLTSGPGTKVLDKNTYSMVSKQLIDDLEDYSINRVCLSGVQTEWCIYQTASELALNGFQVDVIKDACGSANKHEHFDALDELKTIPRIRTPTLHRWIVSRLSGIEDEYNIWYLNLLNNMKKESKRSDKIDKMEIKEDW